MGGTRKMILQYQHNDTPVPNMRYSSTSLLILQYQIAYTKKDTDGRFDRIIPKIILVRIMSIHPYADLVGSN